MDTQIRLGIIGAGIFFHDAHLPALKKLPEKFQVSAICDSRIASAQTMAAEFEHPVEVCSDFTEVLRDPSIEAVDIVLPPDLMPDVIKRALSAGKHVISEKPLALSAVDGKDLLDFYGNYPELVWAVAENWRHEKAILDTARLVREGVIGRIRFFNWNIFYPIRPGHKYYSTGWRRSGILPGGYIFDGGVHHMATLRKIMGRILEVCALGSCAAGDLGRTDSINAAIRMESDVIGNYFITYALDCPWDAKLRIIGEKGAIAVDRSEICLLQKEMPEQVFTFPERDAFQSMFVDFYDCIRNRKTPVNKPIESLQDIEVIEAILNASLSGRVIQIDQIL